MWFKKKAYIIGYNSNTAVDGNDWRTNGGGHGWSTSQTLPSAADAGKYFYLPAVGYYDSGQPGQLRLVGNYCYYWSSSGFPWLSGNAYCLSISNGLVYVGFFNSHYGLPVSGFE